MLTLPVGVVALSGGSWAPTLPMPFLANALALLGKDRGGLPVHLDARRLVPDRRRLRRSVPQRRKRAAARSRPRKGSPRARATLARMATRSKPLNIGRLGEIAQVAVRHGFGYSDRGPPRRSPDRDGAPTARGRHLREMLDELGPTFVKFGQLLSTRPDIVPPDIIAELRGLQDDVTPFPYEEVERVIREELGQPIERLFLEFDDRSRSPRRRSARCTAPCCRTAAASRSRCSARARRSRSRATSSCSTQAARLVARARPARSTSSTRARSSTSSRARSGRSSTTARRAATPTRSTSTSPGTRTSRCRASTGATRARAC